MVKETEEEKKQREMIEGIADNISQLSKSVRSLLGGRVKEQSIIILLAHSTKMTQGQVRNVLDALKHLEDEHLN